LKPLIVLIAIKTLRRRTLVGILIFAALFQVPSLWAAAAAPQSMEPDMSSCSPGEKGAHPNSIRGPLVHTDATEEDKVIKGEHVKTIVYKNYSIDRVYRSMEGPFSVRPIFLDPGPGGGYAWITGYHAETVDHITGKPAPEFMCHTLLNIVSPETNDVKPYIATSQGQSKIEFPVGFAYRTKDKPPSLQLVGMVLNNNSSQIGRTVDFRFTIHYLEQAVAEARQIKPLDTFNVAANCVTDGTIDPTAFACEPAMAQGVRMDKQVSHTRHWLVPPGRHSYTTDVTQYLPKIPFDTKIHYISMHVHPYAESLELRDATANRTVWKGKVKTADDPRDVRILTTDFYSSTKGLPFLKGHRYELVSVYNNRTDHKIDAMAVLWIFIPSQTPSTAPQHVNNSSPQGR
jgi:hypothetical protein